MEKKYLIGYLHGQPHVIFDDIQNFKEEAAENEALCMWDNIQEEE